MLSKDLLNIKGRILLLVCCAPCCAGAVEFIAKNNLDITLFFYNPNIYPEKEYNHRKNEVLRLAKLYNINVIDFDYEPEVYLKVTKGLGGLPERSARCEQCFKLRLLKTAEYAKANNFDYFTSTLGFSRWKDLNQVDTVGRQVEDYTEIPYLDVNWRKCGIQEAGRKVVKENNIYEQDYCGCIYSFNARKPQ